MRKQILVIGVISLFLLAMVGSAWAFGHGMKHGTMALQHYQEMVKLLNLTPDQQVKAKEIVISGFRNSINLRRDLELKRLELSSILLDENPDRAKVNKLIMESCEIQGKLEVQRVDERLDIKKLLTAEQKIKLEEYYQRRAQKMEHFRMMRGQTGQTSGMNMMPGMKRMNHPMTQNSGIICPQCRMQQQKAQQAQTQKTK